MLGLTFEPREEGDGGVCVGAIQPGFIAAQSSLRVGDVLRLVNGRAVATAEDAGDLLKACHGTIDLAVERGSARPRGDSVTPWNPEIAPPPEVGGELSAAL